MSDASSRPPRRVPGWVWVVVPMTISALLFGALAVAVRTSGDDDGSESISGPATDLPAVTDAVGVLLAASPATADIGAALGTRYGEATAGLAQITDPVEYAAQFDRLPAAEARAMGRTLGAMQTQLSPTDVGGARGSGDRAGDIVFALQLARAAIVAMDPGAAPRDQALAILPFSIQDLPGFDALADELINGDLSGLAVRVDDALSSAGASELVSSVANEISDRLQALPDPDLQAEFMAGYGAGTS
ncbi:MAG: hypothetical protein ABW328_12430 [Ilumatobacteraceae bacterium]